MKRQIREPSNQRGEDGKLKPPHLNGFGFSGPNEPLIINMLLRFQDETHYVTQYSANYCYGYLLAYDKVILDRSTNNSEIWSVANKTGWLQRAQNGTATPTPPCTVSQVFCVPFTKAYEQSYKYYVPYWLGNAAGAKYGDHVLDDCTKKHC